MDSEGEGGKPENVTHQKITSSRVGWVLIVCLGAGWVAFGIAMVLLDTGWWPAVPENVPLEGTDSRKCESVYGHPIPGSFLGPQTSFRSVWYIRRGWDILVGYDEQDHTEQIVIRKRKLSYFSPALPINDGSKKRCSINLRKAVRGCPVSITPPTRRGSGKTTKRLRVTWPRHGCLS